MLPIAIAPMLDWSDRHYRYFMRQITTQTVLYSEMIVADAIIHGNRKQLLGLHCEETPVIVQLGGSNPEKLALASKICQDFGYTGINLNVGCPSNRVKAGNFGAYLMSDAKLVATCIKSMQDSVTIPVSIKHRIGLNQIEDYSFVHDFVAIISSYGCNEFIVHARNAVLDGLSPKQNREIPPLKYDYVYKLKQDFSDLKFMLNGGIKTINEIQGHLSKVDGVMIGREAYYNPYLFNNFDELWFNCNNTIKTRYQIAIKMIKYLELCLTNNIHLHHVTRHMIGLYHGCPNAKMWRYTLTNEIIKTNSIDTYIKLVELMGDEL